MCGIAGVFRFDGEPVATATLEAMGAAVAHRGPDGKGMWAAGPVGLVHRRLAIIDLSPAGHQPMLSHCDRYVIVFNGEIYNHLDIRRELESHGTRLTSTSDTEVLVNAIAVWGVESKIGRAHV